MADQAGVKVEWHPRLGTPLSIRGSGLGQHRDFSGGKGLRLQGGQHGQNAVAVLDNLSRFYRLQDAENELVVKSVEQDSLGFKHVRLTQRHGNFRVVGAEVLVHFDQTGEPYEVNGQYLPDLQVDVVPKITPAEAVEIAARDLSKLQQLEGRLEQEPSLVVFADATVPQLAYEFTLLKEDSQGTPDRWRYWVDAVGGRVLLAYDDIKTVSAPTTNGAPAVITGGILTGEGGQGVNLSGWLENSGYYYLQNTNRRWFIYNVAGSGYPDDNTYAYRTTGDWGVSDRIEMSAARNFDQVQRYFSEVHGRFSFNGAGLYARANVHKDINYVNAYWDGTAFTFGDGDGVDAGPLAVLDVCAHEFAHAVTEYSADLVYSHESGALNESFSDIFGACVEFYFQSDGRSLYPSKSPGTADWLCGEDCWISSVALRDLRNPRNTTTVGAGSEQPSRYRGTYWYAGSGDNGGVHINSGVQNFFFYLLCEGGSGNNDGIQYNVTGIGLPNAERVAYRALTVYCTPNTSYQSVRSAWISAAMDLNTNWVASVAAAWSAVGVSAFQIAPAGELSFRGPVGGGFTPASQMYALINSGAVPLNWSVTANGAWLSLSPTNGIIPPAGSNLVSFSIAGSANSLPMGIYTSTLTFTNNADGLSQARPVRLLVGQPTFFAELFDGLDNDLYFQTWTFTPNGSPDFYAVCRETATAFPTDPVGGTTVSLSDDSYVQVTLAGANTVALYQHRTNILFIGSNGYLTLNSGDASLSESFSSHFTLPRVAACFDDLNPSTGGTVSWKQTAELVAVTFSNVPEFGSTTTVSFQIEMFFDGRIRITCLNIGVADGLAGLSAGLGVPAGFVETDLTGYSTCPPPDTLVLVPLTGFVAQGPPGGPFSPASASSYTLSNASPAALNWVAANTQPWVNVSPAGGSLSSGQTASVVVSLTAAANALPAGQYADSVAFSNLASAVVQRRAVTLVAQPLPPSLAEATDTPGWSWSVGGAAPWAGQSGTTHDGVDAAQSGLITHLGETWMQATVQGPGTLTFWWSVSSESNFDYLEFNTNGLLATRISGSVGWTPVSISLPGGTQILRWRYTKDGSVNSGQDRGWVDQVTFAPITPTAPSIVTPPQDLIVAAGGDASFGVLVSGTSPFTYQWRSGCGALPNATNAVLVLPGVTTNLSGCTYWVEVANSLGAVTSSIATLTVVQAGEFFDSFDPGIAMVQWSAFGGVPGSTVLATNYGGYVSGPNSLWFGAATNRYAVTRALNTMQDGAVDFWLRLASGTGSPWETADLPAEGIVLEYSTNTGGSWVELGRYDTSAFTVWTHVSADIPPAAQTANTRFRWRQLSHSGAGSDHWALDNVSLLIGPRPPEIMTQPGASTVMTGGMARFSVQASGSRPLSYQWRRGGSDLTDGSRFSGTRSNQLTIENVETNDAGLYSVRVSNGYGVTNSADALLTVFAGAGNLNFQIAGLSTNNSRVVDHNALTGDDRGGIAVSPAQVFVTGDSATARYNAADLTGGAGLGRMDGLCTDLRSETLYALGNGSTPLTSSGGTVTALIQLNGDTGQPTGVLLPLSQSFVMLSSGNGIFSGYGRVVVHNGTHIYDILLPSGLVIDRGAMTRPGWYGSESWAIWGVAEDFGGALYLAYRDSTAHRIVRTRVPDGLITVVAAFSNLSDMASFTVSPSRNRWYFHYEGDGQFGGTAETLGFADASFVTTNPPAIISQPVSQTVLPGSNATLCVSAAGSFPLAWQWRRNGVDLTNGARIAGANSACLTLSGALESDSGEYSVRIANAYGLAISSNATLLVSALDHFAWNLIASPQADALPFPVTLTALDRFNGLVANYQGCVAMSASTARSNTVGTGISTMNFPMGTFYHDVRTQVIYQPGELGGAGRITALALDVATRPGQIMNKFTIRMKHTPLSAYTNYLWESAGWTVVYQTNLSVASTGWVTFALSTPFDYNGTSSLLVDFSFNNTSYTSDGYCRATARSGVRTLYHRTDSSYGDPLTWSGSSPYPSTSTSTPNLRLVLGGGSVLPVEPAVVCLTNGIWHGVLTVRAPATNLTLCAQDSLGHFGYSNPFQVAPTPPFLLAHPTNLMVSVGDSASFCVSASGTVPLHYLWLRDGIPIADVLQSCLVLTNVQFADSGSRFSCRVTNAHGAITSAPALLLVNRWPIADASATATQLVAPNGLSAWAILDGSRSSDPDGDPLRFLWLETNAAIPLATGMVAVVSLPIGTHPMALNVSDGRITVTNTITITVSTPDQAIQTLKAAVAQSGWQPAGQLLSILDVARAAIARGNWTAAINQLRAFQLMVRAQVQPDDPALADAWIRAAQQVMDALCSAGLAEVTPRLEAGELAGGKIKFNVHAAACWLQVVEASTNLVDWQVIGVPAIRPDGTFEFQDADAPKFPGRFYRIKQMSR